MPIMSNQSLSSKTDDITSDSPTSRNTETCGITSGNTTNDDDIKTKSTETDDAAVPDSCELEKKAHHRFAVKVKRPIYTQSAFDEGHDKQERHSKSFCDQIQALRRQCACSGACAKRLILKVFPFVAVLKGYSVKDDLISDLIAGLTVGIMHIPQGKEVFLVIEGPNGYPLQAPQITRSLLTD